MVSLAKWSVEDYHKMIAAGILCDRNIQLINGELIQMSPEGFFHAAYGGGIADYLRQLLKGKALIREAHPITLANSEPEPDIAIVKLPRRQYFQHHPNPQDIFWLIEISDSTLIYDLNQKQQIYALANIQEYWVLDIKFQNTIIFRQPQGNNYIQKLELDQGQINPVAFPEITILIDKLFEQ